MDTASNGALESEFGTHKEEEVVAKILESGSIVESEVRSQHIPLLEQLLTDILQEHGRSGDRNITAGGSVAH